LKDDDNYAQLRKDAAAELQNYEAQIKKTEQLLTRLSTVLQNVEQHQKFLQEQYDAYTSYLNDVRAKCSSGTGALGGGGGGGGGAGHGISTNGNVGTQVNNQQGNAGGAGKGKKPNKKQKKALRQKRVGPFKYQYNALEKEGIIKKSLVPKDRRNHITFAFSSVTAGVFIVEVSWRGKKISSLQLLLDDLLEKKAENCVDFETDFLTLDVNLLLHLLNKHFLFPNKKIIKKK